MRFSLLLGIFVSVLLSACANRQADNNSTNSIDQTKPTGKYKFSLESAHPRAQVLMAEEFYWSPIEETAPFGNDDGFDAAYGFRDWRHANKTENPMVYLKDLIIGWNYPPFDYTEIDTLKIREYISRPAKTHEVQIEQIAQQLREADQKTQVPQFDHLDDKQLKEMLSKVSTDMGASYLRGIDNAITGTAFAQLVLEGTVDTGIKELAIVAVKRQMLPMLIEGYADDYKDIRKQQLAKMLDILNKVEQ